MVNGGTQKYPSASNWDRECKSIPKSPSWCVEVEVRMKISVLCGFVNVKLKFGMIKSCNVISYYVSYLVWEYIVWGYIFFLSKRFFTFEYYRLYKNFVINLMSMFLYCLTNYNQLKVSAEIMPHVKILGPMFLIQISSISWFF